MASHNLLIVISVLITTSRAAHPKWVRTFGDDGSTTISTERGRTPDAKIIAWDLETKSPISTNDFRIRTTFTYRLGSVRCYLINSYSLNPEDNVSISVQLKLNGHIYGGPAQTVQHWPLDYENVEFSPSIPTFSHPISDPYWLSSDGYFIFVHPETSLFVNQNRDELMLISTKRVPYRFPDTVTLKYTICQAREARTAHMFAVVHYLGKPEGIPDEQMITHPSWSTRVRFSEDLNHRAVKKFANQIIAYGFKYSHLEIEGNWESCLGSLTWNKNKFPSIRNLTQALKAKGFRVTLQVHPFVEEHCEPTYSYAATKGYFVKNTAGDTRSSWNIANVSVIDITNPDARIWFMNRLERMKYRDKINSFYFDFSHINFLPKAPVLTGDLQLQPNLYTENYVDMAAKFGPMVIVSAGHVTQTYPIFVRMVDKYSRWDWHRGLPTLITTLLHMNILGYPLVLPEVVGGSGYEETPTKELFVRWMQAVVFMPVIEFSYVPWDYDRQTIRICKTYVDLHERYAPTIIELMDKAVTIGTPVNPPIWWIAPFDTEAQLINDQFLLGDTIMVAPVLQENATARDIYFPRGLWKNVMYPGKGVIRGPMWIRNYPAPLDVLPYFILLRR